jgi:hypothetical protein
VLSPLVLDVPLWIETILSDGRPGIHLGFRISTAEATSAPANSSFVLDFERDFLSELRPAIIPSAD